MGGTRKNIMLGTAGHVDHGKSALVKLLTGCETDTLAEEKQRGLTIHLGFAPCRLADDRIVGVVDVPGHVDFIRNMVAGAHGIDVVIFVVAADDGIMPQTHEHLHILTLMGLRHGLVALTKIDLVEAGRRSSVVEDIRRLLAGTFLEPAPICPISNLTGEGFEGFFEALNQVVNACGERSQSGLFRVWVEDAFTIRGSGTVITGIPTSGVVRVGDRLALLPLDAKGHVRRLQVYGEDATEGRAGECVAINLPEVDHQIVKRGMVLGSAAAVPPVTMAEGELRILDSVKGVVEDYLEVHLHVGTASVQARVAMLETTGMTAGQHQMVQLRFDEPLSLVPGERFVIRANLPAAGQSGLTTIGGGRILGLGNARLRRRKRWTLDALAARRDAIDDPLHWCELMVRESSHPLTVGELEMKCHLSSGDIPPLLAKLRAEGRIIASPGGAWTHRDTIQQAAAKMLAAIQAFHNANPQRSGLGHEALFASLGGDIQVLNLAVESLLESKQLERVGIVLACAGWRAKLPDSDQGLCDRIAAALHQARWATPAIEELAASLHEPPPRLEKLVRLLAERGELVRLDERIVMHRDAVEEARQVALRLFARAPSFSTMDFRDALGVSRRYAVPLLDYLDKIRFTVRSGNSRTPGAEAKRLQAAGSSPKISPP